ncbi:hypothetical protein EJ04DRAFT_488691 [Polyplosphaeria fusca]|uniref:DUF2231 domain-containing protein n=1 Tax=Polyplosphaeria fusca TaxID=682080 RepID=A0A9P4R0K5_9PLEO|nr:hypothetical protein EJ04DRAFT_488691 [Polyplosphaeria fusca]
MASHPKHPATVHFPITFATLTGALDALYYASAHPSTAPLVASTCKTLQIQLNPAVLPTLSYYTTLLLLITAFPAVITGALELMPLIQRDGFSTRKAQTGLLHAMLNDTMVFGAAYNFWTRRTELGYVPSTTNILISSAFALPVTFLAAYLGGSLIYDYGMGVGRGSNNKAKKSQ